MRVSRAIVASAVGLLVGYLTGLGAAMWLRWSVPDGDVIWNVVSPLRIGAWMLTGALGVPLVVRSAAGVSAPEAAGSVGRISELLGGGSDVVFSFSLFLMPLSVLAIVGITVALLVRRAQPASTTQLLLWAAASAIVHGAGLGLIARFASFTRVMEGNLAPEIGLGTATGHVAIGLGPRPIAALAIGAVWGAAFALAGGMSALTMRRFIQPDTRVILRGWMRGLGTASAIVATGLALGGIYASVAGRAPGPSLTALGGFLLSANAVAAGVVLAHGASMSVALDAGPFTGWERIDFLHFGAAGGAAPKVMWLLAVIPIAAGIVGGRFARRRSDLSPIAVALRYGVLWGLSLAVLAMLLRVRVLSSFSVGALDLGGGSAAFDPLVALGLGTLWGSAAAFIGAWTVSRVARAREATVVPSATWSCGNCGITNAAADRFCVSCGATR